VRKLTILTGAISLFVAGLSSASASHAYAPVDQPCWLTEAGVYICPPQVDNTYTSQSPAISSTIGSAGAGTTSSVVYVPHKRISSANGAACIETVYIPQGTPARPDFGLPDTEQAPGAVSSLYDSAPPCPTAEADGGSPPTVTALSLALSHWARVPLPRPHPRIAPGRAITGKQVYLETRGSNAYTYTSDTVFGILEIVAKGTHYVDWGDGSSSGPFTSDGAPWPEGEITHDYVSVGVVDVVVTTKWTATWRLGGGRGTLPPTETTGRIEDFPVQQIQAVIRQ